MTPISITYLIYFIWMVFSQFLLIYFIIFYSTNSFKTLRVVMLTTTLFQILIGLVSSFLQFQICTHKTPIELISYGPCKDVPHGVCFFLFMMFQTVAISRFTFCTYQLVYKYEHLKLDFDRSTHFIFFRFRTVRLMIPSFMSLSLGIYIAFRDSSNQNNVILMDSLNEQLDTSIYQVFGFIQIGLLPNMINMVALSTVAYLFPIVSLVYRRKITKKIQSDIARFSERFTVQTNSFVLGISIQVVLPLVIYIPTLIFYQYFIITKEEVVVQQHSLPFAISIPVVFDPLINLYFIVPYRRKILSWLHVSSRKAQNTASVIATL